MAQSSEDRDIDIRFGRTELVLRQRYEVISIVNDILIGVWFLVGSFLFFRDSTVTFGTWLFVVGSAQLLIRPSIRLIRRVHLSRVGSQVPETTLDF